MKHWHLVARSLVALESSKPISQAPRLSVSLVGENPRSETRDDPVIMLSAAPAARPLRPPRREIATAPVALTPLSGTRSNAAGPSAVRDPNQQLLGSPIEQVHASFN